MPCYKTNRHSCYNINFHLVVVTRYRHKCINEELFNRLSEITYNIFEERNRCSITAINHGEDHLHILFESPPQVAPSVLINSFKTVSSRLIRKEFADYLAPFYWKPVFWSRSYLLLSTGGAPIEIIKKYIENQ